MLKKPTRTPTGNAQPSDGTTDITARAAPKPTDVSPTIVIEMLVRRAVRRAPTSAPTLTTENSHVYVLAVPPKSRLVNSGNTVWKLYDSVPTIAIIVSGTQSSGTLAA